MVSAVNAIAVALAARTLKIAMLGSLLNDVQANVSITIVERISGT